MYNFNVAQLIAYLAQCAPDKYAVDGPHGDDVNDLLDDVNDYYSRQAPDATQDA